MTLEELIARVKVVALETATRDIRPLLLNTDVLIEVLLPRCLEFVVERVMKTPDGLQSLRGEVTVAFTSGVGTLPSTLKADYVDMIVFKDDPSTSHVPSWHEFDMDPDGDEDPVDYSRFHITNGQIHYHRRDYLKNSFTGNQVVMGILTPVLPTLVGDTVTLNESIIQKLITTTAAVVNGQIPLSQLGLNYGSLERVNKQAI
jgi:hypothetical protein